MRSNPRFAWKYKEKNSGLMSYSNKDSNLVPCPNHPQKMYDPGRYSGCYFCFTDNKDK